MGLPELACRSRQEASKWLERFGASRRVNSHSGAIWHHIAPEWSCDRVATWKLFEHFQHAGPHRFFKGVESKQTSILLAKLRPLDCEKVIATADMLCEKHFDLLGYRGLFFGQGIDWHLDPFSGQRAPLVHWSKIDLSDVSMLGDDKVICELNRHQWFSSLGQAYQLAGDERYAQMFATCVQEWMQANPPGIGINWSSSLEAALRLISWCWALFLFRHSQVLSPELFMEMLAGIWTHATHVERYLSYYFSPNTHLTGEALGLFYAGLVFPELCTARRWRAKGFRILLEQSERQVTLDGVYFEQSTCYQRYTVEIYLHLLILAARNGVAIPPSVSERVQSMLDFLLALRRPDGSVPQIGDADGGWLLPLVARRPDDLRGLFSLAGAYFRRADYAWAGDGPTPELLWFLGPEGLESLETLRPCAPSTAPSRLFAEGGYAVMQSGWDKRAHQLIVDVGPLGCPISGGHGHADLLSVQCSVFGEPFLVDPGTYSYSAGPEWRNFFRSTEAHSSVVIDGVGQAVPTSTFAWRTRPTSRLCRWLSTESLDLIEAEHDAYQSLSDPVIHRRQVLFVKPRYWVIVDDLQGTVTHQVELRFQFAPMVVSVDSAPWIRALGSSGCGLLIRSFATVSLSCDVLAGQLTPIQGWISHDYGQRLPAPVLIYSAVTKLPLRIATLLLPTENAKAPLPVVSPLLGDGQWPIGLFFAETQESIRFE